MTCNDQTLLANCNGDSLAYYSVCKVFSNLSCDVANIHVYAKFINYIHAQTWVMINFVRDPKAMSNLKQVMIWNIENKYLSKSNASGYCIYPINAL